MFVQGSEAWDEINGYLGHVAPDLVAKIQRWTSVRDMFTEHRVEEQLVKALDRKVWLPSGGSLVIDRTEAMVVVDVNTGKFTGKGGNLEETVTKNNVEAAEEIARQLRLRDLGGIIVIDFIDMVLESNREQVLRRLVECLGRDRTKHQVAEVTSLGLVQMTRKRVGQGLIEAFSNVCESCHGRGIHVSLEPIDRSTHRPSSEGGFSHSSGPVKDSTDHRDQHDHDDLQEDPQDDLQDDDMTPLDRDQDSDDSSGETLSTPRGVQSVPTKGGARRPRRGKGR
jgi:Rne/Rng family ribonuclease